MAIPAYWKERRNCSWYAVTESLKLLHAQPKLKSGKRPCERAVFAR